MEDTIAAISTSLGVGAVSIIRVSGEDAIRVVDKIFDKNILFYQNYILRQEKKLIKNRALSA